MHRRILVAVRLPRLPGNVRTGEKGRYTQFILRRTISQLAARVPARQGPRRVLHAPQEDGYWRGRICACAIYIEYEGSRLLRKTRLIRARWASFIDMLLNTKSAKRGITFTDGPRYLGLSQHFWKEQVQCVRWLMNRGGTGPTID